MTGFRHDTRWQPGSSQLPEPTQVVAHYNGRWIDRGSAVPADIVPGRHGFGYDHEQYAQILQNTLQMKAPHCSVGALDFAEPTVVFDHEGVGAGCEFTVHLRRSGGYVYCDAYLTMKEPSPCET